MSKSSPPAASAISRSFGHGVRAEDDERDAPRRLVRLQAPRRFPAVDARQAEIHQDEIRQLATAPSRRPASPSTADMTCIAPALEPPAQRVAAGFVVLDHHDRRHRRFAGSGGGRCGSPAASSTTTGSWTVKREPTPGSLSTETRPPISWQKRDTMARPRPVPPYLRVVVTSACVNGSKILAALLGRHADAGVGHRELDASASRRSCAAGSRG